MGPISLHRKDQKPLTPPSISIQGHRAGSPNFCGPPAFPISAKIYIVLTT